MDRRAFIAYGSAATLAATLVRSQADQHAAAQEPIHKLELHVEEIYEEMIDGQS